MPLSSGLWFELLVVVGVVGDNWYEAWETAARQTSIIKFEYYKACSLYLHFQVFTGLCKEKELLKKNSDNSLHLSQWQPLTAFKRAFFIR